MYYVRTYPEIFYSKIRLFSKKISTNTGSYQVFFLKKKSAVTEIFFWKKMKEQSLQDCGNCPAKVLIILKNILQ